jgi:hypothetical protein
MTKEERAQLEALSERAKTEDAADSEFSIEVSNDKGHKITLRGAQARKYAAKFGIDDDDDAETDDGQGDADQLEHDEKPAGSDGYFKGRK